MAEWVQNHPEESKKIAMAGYKFYVKYLSAEPTKQFVVQYLKTIAKMNITWVDHATGAGAGTDVQTANFRSIVPNPDVIFNKYFYMPKTEASKKRSNLQYISPITSHYTPPSNYPPLVFRIEFLRGKIFESCQ